VFAPFSKRGKAWEPLAVGLRRLVKVGADDLLDPWLLAAKVGLTVMDGHAAISNLSREEQAHLLGAGSDDWSGGVYPMPLPDGTRLCILNPKHSRRRNKITLMEEISHTYLKHKPSGLVLVSDGIQVRDYNKSQEEEAYGVGAATLLPWQTFFRALNSGHTVEKLAEDYDVTTALVTYRIKITGAYNVYQSRQRRRA